MDEQELIVHAQKGNIDAFEQLLKKYQNYIYSVALGIMRSPCDAEDAAQEAMFRIYKALSGFRLDASFSTWIYRITINCCTDQLRSNAKRQSLPIEAAENIVECISIEEQIENAHISEQMNSAIEKLEQEDKEIIVLREMHRFSYDEIAKKLNCSLSAVKSRLFRARQQLRENYKKLQ